MTVVNMTTSVLEDDVGDVPAASAVVGTDDELAIRAVGAVIGVVVGDTVGAALAVGTTVRPTVDGALVDSDVGWAVAVIAVGRTVGTLVGVVVGAVLAVGKTVGTAVDSALVGSDVGEAVGAHVPGVQLHIVTPAKYMLCGQGQLVKAVASMTVMESGITIVESLMQPLNMFMLKVVTELDITTETKL